MRIHALSAVNKNYSNKQQQPNFTALNHINLVGMNNIEKKVVIESLDAIEKVAAQVNNLEIGLHESLEGRGFIAYAYENLPEGDVLIKDCIVTGPDHLLHNKTQEVCVKASLTKLVNDTIKSYFKKFPEQAPKKVELLPHFSCSHID